MKRALLIAALILLTGCKPDAALKHAESMDETNGAKSVPTNLSSTHATLVDPSLFGGIKGTIKFAGTPPPRVKIDMSMDPACALAKGDNLSEQYIVASGRLANVFIYIKSGIAPTNAADDAPVVTLDQHGCRYTPHVVAIQQGGYIQFKNSDPTMHNIHITSDSGGTFDVSQGPMGEARTQQFKDPATMLAVRCNNHPWMNAFINVAPTPFFDISGPDGGFTIRNLPPGTYTLAAVHEKLGEQDVQITVPAKSTVKEEFTFTAK